MKNLKYQLIGIGAALLIFALGVILEDFTGTPEFTAQGIQAIGGIGTVVFVGLAAMAYFKNR